MQNSSILNNLKETKQEKQKKCYLADIKYIEYSNNELSRKMSIEVCKYITNKSKP